MLKSAFANINTKRMTTNIVICILVFSLSLFCLVDGLHILLVQIRGALKPDLWKYLGFCPASTQLPQVFLTSSQKTI